MRAGILAEPREAIEAEIPAARRSRGPRARAGAEGGGAAAACLAAWERWEWADWQDARPAPAVKDDGAASERRLARWLGRGARAMGLESATRRVGVQAGPRLAAVGVSAGVLSLCLRQSQLSSTVVPAPGLPGCAVGRGGASREVSALRGGDGRRDGGRASGAEPWRGGRGQRREDHHRLRFVTPAPAGFFGDSAARRAWAAEVALLAPGAREAERAAGALEPLVPGHLVSGWTTCSRAGRVPCGWCSSPLAT
ncbi:unnamed protein product [Prorocentrum cordatum]|uniref:Uncharacterized protein n=1 Tax=Prorocentrum cordatum TaxID=2364126 RepID=A0ABN9XBI1_9DINO|nr:unnamed protein product [Polarella glacialis]